MLRLNLVCSLVVGVAMLPRSVRADDPVFVVHDHMRDMNITTFSDAWSFSLLSKHGISMIFDPGSCDLVLDHAFSTRDSLEEYRTKRLEVLSKQESNETRSDAEALNVGGVEAIGVLIYVPERKNYILEFWFQHGDVMYEGKMDADEEHFETFRAEAEKVLANIEFLSAKGE